MIDLQQLHVGGWQPIVALNLHQQGCYAVVLLRRLES